MRSTCLIAAVCVLSMHGMPESASALFAPPQGTPVDRLVKNITAYAKENPKDANAQYLLGRVHALALRHDRNVVGTYPRRGGDDKGLPSIAGDHLQRWVRPVPRQKNAPKPGGLSDVQKAGHLAASIAAYAKAIELDPKPAHHHNGLAFVLEVGGDLWDKVAPPDVRRGKSEPTHLQATAAYKTLKSSAGDARAAQRKVLQAYWREAAIEKYLDAYQRAVEKDAQIKFRPLSGLHSLVSFEAGHAYKRLVNKRDVSDAEQKQIATIDGHLTALKNVRQGPVTPIVFHLDHRLSLKQLLDPAHTVRFDLDGDGHVERRPWVQPDTAILCWDPHQTGRITSGKQLFGSVTFHLYPGDGYTAMNLLDDNRDGYLRGAELSGLSLWFDHNTNGVSDRGEVVPIGKTSVESLSVRALSTEGIAPANHVGLGLADGRKLPTYDWIAGSVKAPVLAKEAPHQKISISLKAPATHYRIKITKIKQVGAELWVLAHITSEGIGGDAITTISDSVKAYSALKQIKYFATGKSWNWKNKADIQFIKSEADLGKGWKKGNEILISRR